MTDAIKVRENLFRKKKNERSVRKAFYTRSPLLRSIIPQPSEGKVRALFGTNHLPPIQEKRRTKASTRYSPVRAQSTLPPEMTLESIKNLRTSQELASLTFSELSPPKIHKSAFKAAKASHESLFGLSTTSPLKHFVSAQTLDTTTQLPHGSSTLFDSEIENTSHQMGSHTLSHDVSLAKSIEQSRILPPTVEEDPLEGA